MKKPDARSRILSKAANLFLRRGYSEVGINEIIEESDTAKATFYHHFPSKKQLCEAWLADIHERSAEYCTQLLDSESSPLDKVECYFSALGTYLETNDFRGCPYTNTAVVAGEEHSLVEKIEEHKAGMRCFFHQLAAQITPQPERSSWLGDVMFVLYSGATTEAQNLRDLWPVEVAKKCALDLCRAENS